MALTIWNGRISPVFDVARRVLLVDVQDGKAVSMREADLPGGDPSRQAARLDAYGVQVVICGAVSRSASAMLTAHGLEVIGFVAGSVEEVLAAWEGGRLPDSALAMPGCRRGCGGCMPEAGTDGI